MTREPGLYEDISNAPVIGSPEWRRLVTASKAAAILGLSPWQSPYLLWCEMKGIVEPDAQNAAQSRGHYLEPAILAWFRDQHGLEVGEFWHEQVWTEHGDWAGATVDAQFESLDGLVLVEAKSAARMDEWGDPGTDAIPPYYLAQVHFQLAVTGAARCYVPVIGPYLEFSEYVVERDEDMAGAVLAKCREFCDSLADDAAPDLDAHPATFSALKKQHPEIDDETQEIEHALAVEYVDASLSLKSAEARDREARSRLLDAIGRAKYAETGGLRIARRQAAKHGVSLVRVAKSLEDLNERTPA